MLHPLAVVKNQAVLDCNRGTTIGAGYLAVMISLPVARLRMSCSTRGVRSMVGAAGAAQVRLLLHVLRVAVVLQLSLSRVLHVLQQSSFCSSFSTFFDHFPPFRSVLSLNLPCCQINVHIVLHCTSIGSRLATTLSFPLFDLRMQHLKGHTRATTTLNMPKIT